MTLKAEATYIDTTQIVHQFYHDTDRLGDAYVWQDITGFQHAFLRGMTTPFEVWVSEIIRGIALARQLVDDRLIDLHHDAATHEHLNE